MLTYTTSASKQLQDDDPPYLQTYVYDVLTDSGWQTSDYTANATQASTMPPPQGLNDMAIYKQFRVSVNVADHTLTNQKVPSFLAMPYPATQVSTPPGVWLVDPELMVFSQYPAADVQAYQATSVDVDPTAAQLRAAPRPPSGLSADLELPASYKHLAGLLRIAKAQTLGQTTEFDKVDALAAWLSGPAFTYSAAAPPVNSAASLYKFLSTGRSGVCVQSAWAMTVLARLLGIPARLAGGFTEGTQVSGDSYVVKTDDAHAWAEVYFSGYGWIRFEATPSGGDGTARAGSYQAGAPGTTGGRRLSTGPPHSPPPRRRPGRRAGSGTSSPSPTRAAERRRDRQVRRHAVGRGRAGDHRCHRPGVRGHRDRGPARAPGPGGPYPRRGQAAQAGEPGQRAAGPGRDSDRRARAVPAAVPCLRPGPAGRLGDGRHRLRRGLRVHVRRAGPGPDRDPALALAAGRR